MHHTHSNTLAYAVRYHQAAVTKLLLSLFWASSAFAGGGPENLMLVVNGQSWASLAVANEFIHLRHIPPNHIVYLNHLEDFERTDVHTFRQEILGPVLQTVQRRGLIGQIDYIIYSSDIPHTIDTQADVGKARLPRENWPVGALTGLTYLYQQVLAKTPNYMQFSTNQYMRWPLGQRPQPLTPAQRQLFFQAQTHTRNGQWFAALAQLDSLIVQVPEAYAVHYQRARCLAATGQLDQALDALGQAIALGWHNPRQLASETTFKPLRDQAMFQHLNNQLNQGIYTIQPTLGFRHANGWDAQGQPSPNGKRYLLSTMLAVTSGRGNSLAEALAGLQRSVAADASHPDGTFYFMRNKDVRSTTRAPHFNAAAAHLRRLGFNAAVLDGVLPQGKNDVLGALIGIDQFSWAQAGSRILPGAICEHLTSAGGILGPEGIQTPLTEFIRYGAAGTSGTVEEPYALQQKFPHPFMHVHYAQGASLAEAFYQSVAAPYQLLIVGDPLCRPWARMPSIAVDGLAANASLSDTISLTPRPAPNDTISVARYELYLNGLRAALGPPGQPLTLNTNAIPDGHHELRLVAIAAGPIRTQSARRFPVQINNQGHRLNATLTSPSQAPWDQPIQVQASLDRAAQIYFFHNMRAVAWINGPSGAAQIDPMVLGLGPVVLQPIGILAEPEEELVWGPPLALNIHPALPQTGWPSAMAALGRPGLQLSWGTDQQQIITRTDQPNWLTTAGVDSAEVFSLHGFFRVDETGLCQFQLKSNMALTLSLDGEVLLLPAMPFWRFIPFHLKKGVHRLQIWARARAAPHIQLRYGQQGTAPLNGQDFRHIPRPSPQRGA